jgi:hypothetical protein
MTIVQAREEFDKRFGLWALYTAERAIEASLPHFDMFKGGVTWNFRQFVLQLTRREQIAFVRMRRKEVCFKETGGRSEPLSEGDKELRHRYNSFCWGRRGLEIEIRRRRRAGEKIKFASKKTLHSAIKEKFVGVFGDRGIEVEPSFHNGVGLQMICAGWLVITTFTSGRSAGEMDYTHLIAGTAGQIHPDGTVTPPSVVLAHFAWTGICHMQWEYLCNEDVTPACDCAVELCREVFDALPKLLYGIERDKVVDEGADPINR